jgi:hypothetical protein
LSTTPEAFHTLPRRRLSSDPLRSHQAINQELRWYLEVVRQHRVAEVTNKRIQKFAAAKE